MVNGNLPHEQNRPRHSGSQVHKEALGFKHHKPGNLLEMQSLSPHMSPTDSEWVCVHVHVGVHVYRCVHTYVCVHMHAELKTKFS